MCDVYFEECYHSDCKISLFLHLADFDTARDEIQVYCKDHLPECLSDGVLYEVNDAPDYSYGELYEGYHGKMFMRTLTKNARDNWSGNDYNGDCKTLKIFGMNKEKEKAFLEEENRKAQIWLDDMEEAHAGGTLMKFLKENQDKKRRRVRNERVTRP